MNKKAIRMIKRVSRKTLLPLKKKCDRLLQKLYFSISFRIAFYYVRLFIIFGVIFFMMIYGIYVSIEVSKYNSYADTVERHLQTGEVALDPWQEAVWKKEMDTNELSRYRLKEYREFINPYQGQGISLRITEKERVQYSDITQDVMPDKRLWNVISYNYQDNHRLIIKKKRTCVYGERSYELYFQFDITESIENMHRFFLFFILLYIALIIFVGKFGQHGIEKLLQPLRSMSATANRLTVNNLHSERLNVAGTKNELKELAGTMNAMLDRLECSYENQKQFVSDASHELRTPIAVIQGYANLLARWGKEDKEILDESIDAITKEANSMKELVEKLLFLSRHDKKTLYLNRARFNMGHTVEEMVKETRMVEQHRRIEAPMLEDVMVYGDEQALKQAIRVFIDNAIKYTTDGDTIRISCKNKEGTCIIVIEDTGIGMKKEEIKQIFERFYRADSVRNGGVEGHGLGLSIAKLIILKHVGTIRVRSQFEKGSKFTIILPDYYSQGFLK